MIKRLLKKPTVWIGLTAIISLSIIGWVFLSPSGPKTRDLELELSKETTYYTGPVRDDGTIDYIAAINQELSEGITPDHNAFYELSQILNDDSDPYYNEALLNALSIALDEPSQLPSFEPWHITYNKQNENNLEESDARDILYVWLESPYEDRHEKTLAAWVRANAHVLDHCEKTLEKPNYWRPLVDLYVSNSLLMSLSDFFSLSNNQLAFCYRARLLLAARNGDTDLIVRSSRAMRKLAQLQSNEHTTIGCLIAISIEAHCNYTIRSLLSDRLLDDQTLALLIEEWGPGVGRLPIIQAIDRYERCASLDGLMQLAAGRTTTSEIFALNGVVEVENYDQNTFDRLYVDSRFDIHLALEIVQSYFDELTEMMRNQNYIDYSAASDMFESQIEQQKKRAVDQLIIIGRGERQINGTLKNPEYTTYLTNLYLGILVPALSMVHRVEVRTIANDRNTLAAMAVERYRLKHDRLPNTLAELVPTYLDAVPIDPFDGQPVRYRQTDNGFVVYSIGSNLKDDGGWDEHGEGDTAIVVDWSDAYHEESN